MAVFSRFMLIFLIFQDTMRTMNSFNSVPQQSTAYHGFRKTNLLRMMARTTGKFAVGDLAKPPLDKDSYIRNFESQEWQRLEAHLLIDPKLQHLQQLREELGEKCAAKKIDWQVYEHVRMPNVPGYPDFIVGDNRGLWPQHRRLLVTIPFQKEDEEATKAELSDFVGKLCQEEKLEMCTMEGIEQGPMADVIKYGLIWESGSYPSPEKVPDTAFAISRIIQVNWASQSRIRNGVQTVIDFQKNLLENGALWSSVLQADDAVSVVKTVELYESEDQMLQITNSTMPGFLAELAPYRAAVNLVAQAQLPISSCILPALRTRIKSKSWMPQVAYPAATNNRVDAQSLENALLTALQLGYRHIFISNEDGASVLQRVLDKASRELNISRKDIFISYKHQVPVEQAAEDVKSKINSILKDACVSYLDAIFLEWSDHAKNGDSLGQGKKNPFMSSWKELHEGLLQQNCISNIGVSNLDLALLQKMSEQSVPLPDLLLTKCNPIDTQTELRLLCRENDISLVADFQDPGKGETGTWQINPTIKDVSKGNRRSPVQTVMAWNLQHGHSVLTPFVIEQSQMLSNLDLQTYNLLEDDVDSLEKLTEFEK